MRTINLIALLGSTFFIVCVAKAQTPINDPAWTLQPSGTSGGTEEFNSSLDFTNKWRNQYPWGPVNNGAEYNYAANVIQSDTTLKIKADTLIPGQHHAPSVYASTPTVGVTYAYQGGVLYSKHLSGNAPYKYGYLEISAKYPTSYYALWPSFYLFSADCNSPFYNEIDNGETSAPISYDGHQMSFGAYANPTGCSIVNPLSWQPITGLPLLSAAFHKYGMEWEPDRVNWYFDNVLVQSYYDASGVTIPQNAQDVILEFAIDPWWSWLPNDWNAIGHGNWLPTHFNQSPSAMYFEIDYLRYYKLSLDCSTNLTNLCTPAGYDRKVKKSIVTDNTCTPTFNPTTTSGSYTLRATDYVTLDAGVTINPSGTGYFAVEVMPCPQ